MSSFADSPKAQFWSDKNIIRPEDVTISSHKMFWFNCNICNHEFEASLGNITHGYWCPYCSKPPKKLCKNDTCNHCFNKSFASNEKAKCWSDKNEKKPREVFPFSCIKHLFDCDICSHSFETRIDSISLGKAWCPYCSNSKLCEDDKCQKCHDKSFANSSKAKYWSVKNEKKPRDVFKCSGKKYIFDCEKCNNSFKTRLNDILHKNRWCPHCQNKTETKLLEYLSTVFPKVIHQAKFNWCKHTTFLPFDFYIPSKKLIIELDGPQHYTQISNWDNPFKTQIKDAYKDRMARQNGFIILRLLQEDVLYDKKDWKTNLPT